MFFKQSGYTWLVVGLGNPGARFESTRHNMGFLALDRLAEREKLRFNKLRFKAWTAEWKLGEDKVLVMKPQTYMNLSGESAGAAARFYKIPADHILVVSDDISLPVGKLRLRSAGSAGGLRRGGLGHRHAHGRRPESPAGRSGSGGAGHSGGHYPRHGQSYEQIQLNWRKNFVFSAKGIAARCAHNFAAGGKITHLRAERYFSPRACRGEK